MRHNILIACAVLALGAPSLALAQAKTPAKPAASGSALQLQLATKMLDFIEYKNGLRARMTGSNLPPELLAVRPDWDGLWKQAMSEELDHDMPTIESMVAGGLAKVFTDDEIKSGLQIIADPALKTIYLAAQQGGNPPGVTLAKATDDLMNTPTGSSFIGKLQKIDDVMDPVQIEVMATVMPGVMKRFGEKAEAAEIAKRASAGYAAAK